MPNNGTILSRLNHIIMGSQSVNPKFQVNRGVNSPAISDTVLYSTRDKAEYERKLTQLKQQKFLSYQWVKAGADTAAENLAGYTAVKLMYRDSDLMDACPEIAAALDIMSEETCSQKSDGKILNIYSKSKRIKSILEDLFINRLDIHVKLPMIARDICKYGNDFELLNIDSTNGVLGWKKLPVYQIDRIENGYNQAFAANGAAGAGNIEDLKPDEVVYVWNGHNENIPYKNWQIAHFRLLNDSFFLPYGTSALHKARRAWRMWSMMEDAMLIHHLDKAVERRIFKIYVGGIDDQDVPAYIQEIANNFKRTPVIDPETGQVDLRKNFLDVSSDYFIPVRQDDPTSIDTLAGSKNESFKEDIEYMQNKIFAALRVPKTFLNFQEAQGKGQNLGIQDIRFSRMINRVQQFIIMELNKIAMIHLYLLGMGDDINNFTLSMNNPSNQVEAQEIDDLTKKAGIAAQLLADPGIGMPLYSLHKVLRDIMKIPDAEIKDMVNEIRLEKAMAAELAATPNVIKKTGIFDPVDRIYGDFDALYGQAPAGGAPAGGDMSGGMGGGGGAAPMGGDMGGGDMAMGDAGMEGGDMAGAEGGADMGAAPAADAGAAPAPEGGAPLMERRMAKSFTQQYLEMLDEASKKDDNYIDMSASKEIDEKSDMIVENMNNILSKIDDLTENDDDVIE